MMLLLLFSWISLAIFDVDASPPVPDESYFNQQGSVRRRRRAEGLGGYTVAALQREEEDLLVNHPTLTLNKNQPIIDAGGHHSLKIPTISPPIRFPDTVDTAVAERVAQSLGFNPEGRDPNPDPLGDCSPTSRVEIFQTSPHWRLQAFDEKGAAKTVGGDEFYVTYMKDVVGSREEEEEEAPPTTAVAHVTDLQDGTYLLDFVQTPMSAAAGEGGSMHSTDGQLPPFDEGRGTVTVHFEYTCGLGRWPQPTKQRWLNGACLGISHNMTNVTAPPIRAFRAPKGVVDLGSFDRVLAYGDSVMEQLFARTPPAHVMNKFQRKIGLELSSETYEIFMSRLKEWHSSVPSRVGEKAALVLGSEVWDLLQENNTLQGEGFEDHLECCRRLVREVRDTFPSLTVLWKSATAVHVHKSYTEECMVSNVKCRERTKYMSQSRAMTIYEGQKEIMEELNVPFIDVFEATLLSAEATEIRDGRHYSSSMNDLMISWLYSDPYHTTNGWGEEHKSS